MRVARAGAVATAAMMMMILWAAPIPAVAAVEVPEVLTIDGAPIDPYCFQKDAERFVPRDCLSDDMAEREPPDYDDAPPRPGWVERYYRYTDLEDFPSNIASAAYRYVGETPAGHVVETLMWGGGTGQFSMLVVFRREGDELVIVETPLGGDRCNGGIADTSVSGGVLSASAAITPYDLLAIALDAEPPVQAYDDLAACAACCVGTVTLRGGAVDHVRLGFDEEAAQPFSEPGDETPQACLDALIGARGGHAAPVLLDRAALSALGQDFLARCIR